MLAVVVRGLFFIHSTKFQVQSIVKGAKCHPVKDMEVLQISESGCVERIQKKTTNMMQKDAMIQSISPLASQIGSQVVKSQFFGNSPHPLLPHRLSWWKSFTVQPRFLASLGCPKFGIDFSCEVL